MHHLAHQLITAPRLAAEGSGFAFVGQFRVIMQLDASTDWSKFEYRQYIKGTCFVNHGRFSGTPHSRANWNQVGSSVNGASYFRMTGGLNATEYREDNEIVNGVPTKFGHRSNRPTVITGLQDHYLPTQRTGRIYHSLDTFGIRGTSREVGLRIVYNLHYEGRIIDTSLPATGSQTILRRRWSIAANDIIP